MILDVGLPVTSVLGRCFPWFTEPQLRLGEGVAAGGARRRRGRHGLRRAAVPRPAAAERVVRGGGRGVSAPPPGPAPAPAPAPGQAATGTRVGKVAAAPRPGVPVWRSLGTRSWSPHAGTRRNTSQYWHRLQIICKQLYSLNCIF